MKEVKELYNKMIAAGYPEKLAITAVVVSVIISAVVVFATYLAFGWVISFIWNNIFCEWFDFNTISFWQGTLCYLLAVFIKNFFG